MTSESPPPLALAYRVTPRIIQLLGEEFGTEVDPGTPEVATNELLLALEMAREVLLRVYPPTTLNQAETINRTILPEVTSIFENIDVGRKARIGWR